MSRSHFIGLDQLDIQLMVELESDVRQTYTALATKLGVTRPIITNRVRRLLDSGVIHIFCLAEPAALGFEIIATLAINIQSGHIKDVVQRLVACTSIRFVYLCTGSFNIVAWAFIRNNEDLEHLLIDELDSIPGVQHVETMLLLQVVKWFPVLLADGSDPRIRENQAKDPIKVDDLDVKLIRELQINARQKTTHLAQKLGVHVATVNRRIQRLVYEDVIQFRTVIEPLSLGYHGMALISLSCDPAKVNDVANAVASYKQVQFAGFYTGRYDIIAWVAFQKLSDLQHFINVELGSVSGLRQKDTMIAYKVVKAKYQLHLQ